MSSGTLLMQRRRVKKLELGFRVLALERRARAVIFLDLVLLSGKVGFGLLNL